MPYSHILFFRGGVVLTVSSSCCTTGTGNYSLIVMTDAEQRSILRKSIVVSVSVRPQKGTWLASDTEDKLIFIKRWWYRLCSQKLNLPFVPFFSVSEANWNGAKTK